jgi:hypothetical protein
MATFGMWEFTNDRTATIDAYARIERGGSDTCSCIGCRNFVAARDNVYPSEFIALLNSLGIDSRKDGEVYHNAQLSPGRHDYGGWFHFVGTLEKTGDFPFVPDRHSAKESCMESYFLFRQPCFSLPLFRNVFAGRWHVEVC